ncbi:hypothetical protein ACHAXS_014257 [Conticribra weissflogii]
MPPRPRKRKPSETASDSEGSESVTAPTPAKKPKSSSTKAELRERARLAILNSKSGRSSSASVLRVGGGRSAGTGGAAVDGVAGDDDAPATAFKAGGRSSGGGVDSGSGANAPSSTVKRRASRKAIRKSTGTAAASASSADESETGDEKKVAARRGGRKSAPVAFRPSEPTVEEGGGEEENGNEEQRQFGPNGTPVRRYGPNGTPVARTKTNEVSSSSASLDKRVFEGRGMKEGRRSGDEDMSDAKSREAPAASSSQKKKLREEGHARALAYKMQLEQKKLNPGEKMITSVVDSPPKSPALSHSSDRKVAAPTPAKSSATASTKKMARSVEETEKDNEEEDLDHEMEGDKKPPSKLPRFSSPDPPESRAATASVSVAMAAAAMTTRTTTNYRSPPADPSASSAAAKSAAATKSARTKPTKKSTNPAVAAIFAAKPPSAAHRPNRQTDPTSGLPTKFDPNLPFPSAGYRLPTAAYCGCGPTPFSSRSANATTAATAMMTAGTSDLCRLDSTGATQSQYSANMQRIMREIPPVDPPHRSFSRENLDGGGGGNGTAAGDGVDHRGMGNTGGAADADDDDVTMKENDTCSNNSSKPSPPGKNGYEVEHQNIRKTPVPLEVYPTVARTAVDPPVPVPTQMQRSPVPANASYATSPAAKPMSSAVLNAAAMNPEVMQSATKAFAMVAKAKRENEQRRKMMGIGANRTPTTNGDDGGEGANVLGHRDRIRVSDPPIVGEEGAPTTGVGAVPLVRDDIFSERVAEKAEEKVTTEAAVAATEEEMEDVATRQKTRSFGARLVQFGLVVFVALLATGGGYFVFYSRDSSTMNSIASLLHSEPFPGPEEEIPAETQPDREASCFIDHPSDFFSPGEDLHRDESICGGEYVKCPRRGRCHGGRLRDCNSDGGGEKFGFALFVPNDNADACVPSAEALDLVKKVEGALLELTAEDACRWWSLNNYEYPTFGLWAVADGVSKQMNDDDESITPETLQWLLPVFDSSRVIMQSAPATNIGIIGVMGLGNGVLPMELPLSFTCMARFGTVELIVSLLCWSFTFAWNTAKSSLIFAIYNPIASFVLFCIAFIANIFRKRHQRRVKIKELLAETLVEVYDRLAEYDDNDSYPNINLRDDIGHEKFPLDIRERNFFYDQVWPLVVREICADNRVAKTLKVVNGKKMQHWQMDGQVKRVRKSRRSIGSVASGMQSVQTKSPTERDP